MSKTIPEKRARNRKFFSVTLEYSYHHKTNGDHACLKSSALTTNISDGGLGIYTDRFLPEGQAVSLLDGNVSSGSVGAQVRWCRRISDTLFRVGLMFTDMPVAAT